MSVYQQSRYEKVEAILQRKTVMLKLRERKKYSLENASYYTVVQGDTIDGIAYKYYNSASLYWVIMDANPKYQSELDIKAGDILVIPSIDSILRG